MINILVDIFQTVSIAGLSYLVWKLYQLNKKAEALISEETRRKQEHTKAFQRLTDPDSIEADFEKSARAAEMRAANRKTLPRENTGPHAKIHTPRELRGRTPKKD